VWIFSGLRISEFCSMGEEGILLVPGTKHAIIQPTRRKVGGGGKPVPITCNCRISRSTVNSFCCPIHYEGVRDLKFPIDRPELKRLLDSADFLGHSPRRTLAVMLKSALAEGYLTKYQVNFAMHFAKNSKTHATYARNWQYDCLKSLIPFSDWLQNFIEEYEHLAIFFGFVSSTDAEPNDGMECIEGAEEGSDDDESIVKKGVYKGIPRRNTSKRVGGNINC